MMLMSPMIVGPRMGSMTLTLAVFLNLTLGGLPWCCFFKKFVQDRSMWNGKQIVIVNPPVLYLRVCLGQGSDAYLC